MVRLHPIDRHRLANSDAATLWSSKIIMKSKYRRKTWKGSGVIWMDTNHGGLTNDAAHRDGLEETDVGNGRWTEDGPLQACLRSRATDDSIAPHPGQLNNNFLAISVSLQCCTCVKLEGCLLCVTAVRSSLNNGPPRFTDNSRHPHSRWCKRSSPPTTASGRRSRRT